MVERGEAGRAVSVDVPWWVWDESEPRAFARLWRHVDAQAVHELFGTPGFGPEPPAERCLGVLGRVAAHDVAYRFEPPVYPSHGRGQALRDSAQVLRTGEATCIEIALVVAAGCVRAGLACWVVGGVDRLSRARHVWLVVDVGSGHEYFIDGSVPPGDVEAWERRPGRGRAVEMGEELVRLVGVHPERHVVVDPSLLCVGAPGTEREHPVGADALVDDGPGYLARFDQLVVSDVGGWWTPSMLVPRPGARSDPAAVLRPIWALDAGPEHGAPPPPLSTLLRADRRVVPFQVTDTTTHVVTEVERWAARLDDLAVPSAGLGQVALVVLLGEGGSGKTRLALEAVDVWTGTEGTLGRGAVRGVVHGDASAAEVAAVVGEPGLVVVVLDYADATPSTVVREMLQVLAIRPPGWGKVVLVATGREEGAWLVALRRALSPLVELDLDVREDMSDLEGRDLDRSTLFRRGAEAVAAARRQPVRAVVPSAEVLQGGTPLDVLLRAGLAQVADVDPGDGADLYRAALDHERSYWAQQVHRIRVESGDARPLGADDAGRTAAPPLSERMRAWLDELVAIVSLCHPTPATLDGLVDAVVHGAGAPVGEATASAPSDPSVDLGELLRRLYPGEGGGGWQRIGGLRPDPLADHLIRTALPRDDRSAGPLTWSRLVAAAGPAGWPGLVAALDRVYTGVPEPTWLTAGLGAALAEEETAGSVLAAAGRGDGPARRAVVTGSLADDAPPWVDGTVEDEPALGLSRQAAMVASLEVSASGTAELAEAMVVLARDLHRSGRPEEAADAIVRAAEAHLALARAPEGGNLATSILGLAVTFARMDLVENALEALTMGTMFAGEHPPEDPFEQPSVLKSIGVWAAGAGNTEMAVGLSRHAVARYREAVAEGQVELRVDLAAALVDLSSHWAAAGRVHEAVPPSAEAVELLRTLVAEGRSDLRVDLAFALGSHVVRSAEVGQRGHAVVTSVEAVTLLRALVAEGRSDLRDQLAGVLTGLGSLLADVGRVGEAVAPSVEAVDLLRASVAEGRPALRSRLAMSLSNLGVQLARAGRVDEAVAPTEESVHLSRVLVAENRPGLRAQLARVLNNLGTQLASVGRVAEAIDSSEECVELLRELVGEGRVDLRDDLASALSNLGARLEGLGRVGEALGPTEEALELRRALVADGRPELRSDVAMTLSNLGIHLANVGRVEEAVAPTEEAVALLRALIDEGKDELRGQLASALGNLGIRLADLGRMEEAVAPSVEAVDLVRVLVDEGRSDLRDLLARSLSRLGNRLSTVGRTAEAVGPSEEGVALARVLVGEGRLDLRDDLGRVLNNLGSHLSDVGRVEEALLATEESVEIRRALVREGRTDLRASLAISCENLGNRLGQVERYTDALASSEAAIRLYRELVGEGRIDQRSPLARTLRASGSHLAGAGRAAEAVAPTEESVALLRDLVDEGRSDLHDQLARSVSRLAGRFFGAERVGEAVEASEEAVTLLRDLVGEGRGDLRSDLAGALHLLGRLLPLVDRADAAVPVLGEAVGLLRDLVSEQVDGHPGTLAHALLGLGDLLGELGRADEAEAPTQEAVAIYLDLVTTDRGRDAPVLARALRSLGARLGETGRPDDVLPWWVRAVEQAQGAARSVVQAHHAEALADLWYHAQAAEALTEVAGRYVEVPSSVERDLLVAGHEIALAVAVGLPSEVPLPDEYRIPPVELLRALEGWAQVRGTEEEIALLAVLGEIRPALLLAACDHLVFTRPGEGLDEAVDDTFGRLEEEGVEGVVRYLTATSTGRRWATEVEAAVAAREGGALGVLLDATSVAAHGAVLEGRTAPEAATARALVRRAEAGGLAVALAVFEGRPAEARREVVRALGAGRVAEAADLVAVRVDAWSEEEVALVEWARTAVDAPLAEPAGREAGAGDDPRSGDVRMILRNALDHAADHHPGLARLLR